MIISILYMFRAVRWPSSGELNVSIQQLVYVTLKTIIWYMSLLKVSGKCHSENNYLVYVSLKKVSGICHSQNKYLV